MTGDGRAEGKRVCGDRRRPLRRGGGSSRPGIGLAERGAGGGRPAPWAAPQPAKLDGAVVGRASPLRAPARPGRARARPPAPPRRPRHRSDQIAAHAGHVDGSRLLQQPQPGRGQRSRARRGRRRGRGGGSPGRPAPGRRCGGSSRCARGTAARPAPTCAAPRSAASERCTSTSYSPSVRPATSAQFLIEALPDPALNGQQPAPYLLLARRQPLDWLGNHRRSSLPATSVQTIASATSGRLAVPVQDPSRMALIRYDDLLSCAVGGVRNRPGQSARRVPYRARPTPEDSSVRVHRETRTSAQQPRRSARGGSGPPLPERHR